MIDLFQFEADQRDLLLSAAPLAKVNIVSYAGMMNLVVADAQGETDFSALWQTPRGGGSGAGVVIGVPRIECVNPDEEGPTLQLITAIGVAEERNLSQAPGTGCGIRAENIAGIIIQRLHQLVIEGLGMITAARKLIEPEGGFGAGVAGYTINLTAALVPQSTLERCARPGVIIAAGLAGLTCVTASADIYWTLDGTFPGPGNAGATKFTAAFPVSSGQILRFAAWRDDLNNSVIRSYPVP